MEKNVETHETLISVTLTPEEFEALKQVTRVAGMCCGVSGPSYHTLASALKRIGHELTGFPLRFEGSGPTPKVLLR